MGLHPRKLEARAWYPHLEVVVLMHIERAEQAVARDPKLFRAMSFRQLLRDRRSDGELPRFVLQYR